MTRSAEAFDDLISLLRGGLPNDTDWDAIIYLANHTLVTPDLYAAICRFGQLQMLDDDVRAYLHYISDRNRERNFRMRAQLMEAIAEFNRFDIIPVLLKGAVPLFLARDDALPSRITSDLDVAVDASQYGSAEACLLGLGYEPAEDFRGMGRHHDVGLFELRPLAEGAPPIGATIIERVGVRAVIPPPLERAGHWIHHDMIKEGDFVRGRLDLRHLLDLAKLDDEAEMRWCELIESSTSSAERRAIETQLYTLHALCGVAVPESILQKTTPRFHHWRRVFGARHRIAGAPLRITANIVWGMLHIRRLGVRFRRDKGHAIVAAARAVFQLRPRAKL